MFEIVLKYDKKCTSLCIGSIPVIPNFILPVILSFILEFKLGLIKSASADLYNILKERCSMKLELVILLLFIGIPGGKVCDKSNSRITPKIKEPKRLFLFWLQPVEYAKRAK